MTSQLVEFCAVCGRVADDTHHGRLHDLSQGKGSGGTSLDDAEHFHHIPLCRSCHDGIHNKTIVATANSDGGFSYVIAGGGTVTRTETTDLELCDLWADGDRLGKQGIAMQARAALEFRARYGAYGMGWTSRAAELIRETTGCPVSQTTIYDRAALGIFLQACGDDAEQALMTLGTKVATAVGKASDPAAALEQAHAGRDEGRRMTDVAREIANIARGGRLAEKEPCESHICRRCGEEWEE
jgi:ribosomal protein L37AE/L43A